MGLPDVEVQGGREAAKRHPAEPPGHLEHAGIAIRCVGHRSAPGDAAPYLRFDACDYSLDPQLVGRRVEVRVSHQKVVVVAEDTSELACRHPRSFARHRTVTALEHARGHKRLDEGRGRRSEPAVEVRPLAHYDELIA